MRDTKSEMLNDQAYQNGFRDGMSVNSKFPQTLSLMGYNLEELCELIVKDQTKMTRDEAKEILDNEKWADADRFLRTIEALGLIKFDKPKVSTHFSEATEKYGTVRVEEWPEGLVVWVGGKIRYKSWE